MYATSNTHTTLTVCFQRLSRPSNIDTVGSGKSMKNVPSIAASISQSVCDNFAITASPSPPHLHLHLQRLDQLDAMINCCSYASLLMTIPRFQVMLGAAELGLPDNCTSLAPHTRCVCVPLALPRPVLGRPNIAATSQSVEQAAKRCKDNPCKACQASIRSPKYWWQGQISRGQGNRMEKDRDAIFGMTRHNQVTKSRPLESQFTPKPVASCFCGN